MVKKKPKVKPKPKPESIPVTMTQPFYNLYQTWLLKGAVCSWEAYRRYPYIQPKGGHYEDFIGGKGVFFNETIIEWLYLVDADMEVYNRMYKTGAVARGKIKKGKRLTKDIGSEALKEKNYGK
jgi:hypothetical protein